MVDDDVSEGDDCDDDETVSLLLLSSSSLDDEDDGGVKEHSGYVCRASREDLGTTTPGCSCSGRGQ